MAAGPIVQKLLTPLIQFVSDELSNPPTPVSAKTDRTPPSRRRPARSRRRRAARQRRCPAGAPADPTEGRRGPRRGVHSGGRRQREGRRRHADQLGDRVFHGRPRDPDVDRLGARRLELRFGQRDVGLRRQPADESIPRQLQRALVGRHRRIEQLAFAIESAKQEVVRGQFGVEAEADEFEIGGRRLRGRPARLDAVANASPDVGFVGDARGSSRST